MRKSTQKVPLVLIFEVEAYNTTHVEESSAFHERDVVDMNNEIPTQSVIFHKLIK